MSEQNLLQTIAVCFDKLYIKHVRATPQQEKDYFVVSIETPEPNPITIRIAIENRLVEYYSDNQDKLKNSIIEFVQTKINETLKNHERVEYLPEGQRAWVLNL